jgi:tetratricopeptide (TPR) repeat protein
MNSKRTIFIILTFLALQPAKVMADTASQQAVSKFVSADYHYKQGQFVDAIREYESILSSGLESGNLYYNLGNAYYKNNQLGKALVNYKRAEHFVPRDSDLKFNENLVRDQLHVDEQQNNIFEKLFAKHIAFYTEEEMITIITGLGFIILFGYLFLFFIKPQIRFKWILMIGLVLVFLVYLIGLCFEIEHDHSRALVISSTPANYEPLEKSTAYYQLKEGEDVEVVSEDSGWYKIKRYDGKLGWIPKEKLEKI